MCFDQRAGFWFSPAQRLCKCDKPLSTKSLPGVRLNVRPRAVPAALQQQIPPLAAWTGASSSHGAKVGHPRSRFLQIRILGGSDPFFHAEGPPFPAHPAPYLPKAPPPGTIFQGFRATAKPRSFCSINWEWVGQERVEAAVGGRGNLKNQISLFPLFGYRLVFWSSFRKSNLMTQRDGI